MFWCLVFASLGLPLTFGECLVFLVALLPGTGLGFGGLGFGIWDVGFGVCLLLLGSPLTFGASLVFLVAL